MTEEAAPFDATVQAAPKETVRVLCNDGYMFDMEMPVAWDLFMQNYLRLGGLLYANMWIERHCVNRIVRWAQSGGSPPAGTELGNVTLLRPVKT